MEKEREIKGLVNVLRRIAGDERHAAWMNAPQDTARFNAARYNRVLARLGELEPSAAQLFAQLPEDSSHEVIHMAARELSAYFEDEAPHHPKWRYRHGHCRTPRVVVGWAPGGVRCW